MRPLCLRARPSATLNLMRTGGHGATKVKMLNEKKNNNTQRGLFRVWQTTKNVIYNRILFLIPFHPPKTNLI